MSERHTPGPWVLVQHSGGGLSIGAQPKPGTWPKSRLCDMVTGTEADARLMACAPYLLAEAIELLRNATYADGYGTILTQDAEALEAAIAKATGEEP